MNAARVCYLLIALLLCQTAVAFYDSHEEQQDIATHVPPHHLDGADTFQLPPEAADTESSDSSHPSGPDFCHHCCHCHGVSAIGLPGQPVSFPNSGAHVLRATGNPSFTSGYFSALFRPPIA
jgi:hypothetical protein